MASSLTQSGKLATWLSRGARPSLTVSQLMKKIGLPRAVRRSVAVAFDLLFLAILVYLAVRNWPVLQAGAGQTFAPKLLLEHQAIVRKFSPRDDVAVDLADDLVDDGDLRGRQETGGSRAYQENPMPHMF